jgi:hypothetical protein
MDGVYVKHYNRQTDEESTIQMSVSLSPLNNKHRS